MAVKTASFTGLQPPEAPELQRLGYEQQALLQRLQKEEEGLAVAPTAAGRYNVLNLDGLANALVASRHKGELEINRKKQADLLGKYQSAVLEQLAKYNPDDLKTLREARNSPYPEVRERAEADLKAFNERAAKLADRGSFETVAASSDPRSWQPRENQQVVEGVVTALTEGRAPRRVSPEWTAPVKKDGVLQQTNPLTGKVDEVGGRGVHVTNVNDKADAAGASEGVRAVLGRADELTRTTTQQVRALASMEEASKQGAYQGPISNWASAAAGLARQFGLAGEDMKRVLAESQALDSDSGRFVLAIVRQLGTNPSNADRAYAEQTSGNRKLSQEGLLKVIRAARADLANTINEHNARVEAGKQTGVKSYELGRIRMPLWRKGDLDGFVPDAQGTYMPVVQGVPTGAPNMSDYLPGGRYYNAKP